MSKVVNIRITSKVIMKEDLYIIGLWLGDKYWWGSSIGLVNTKLRIAQRFVRFLRESGFPVERIKVQVRAKNFVNRKRIAEKLKVKETNIHFSRLKKGKRTQITVYVNSRKFKKEFIQKAETIREKIKTEDELVEYLKGRFDADGHFDQMKKRVRIAYTTLEEAKADALLIQRIVGKKPKVVFYEKANEAILELIGKKWENFIFLIAR